MTDARENTQARLRIIEEKLGRLAHLEGHDLKRDSEQQRRIERLEERCEMLKRLFVEMIQSNKRCDQGLEIAVQRLAGAVEELATAMSGDTDTSGHFSMHVTAVQFNQEDSMPAIDTTPDFDLSASNVRAKISVVGPKATATGPYLTNTEVTWDKSSESEPGAIELEPAPEGIQYERDGTTPVLDAAGAQIPVYSTFVNTPLEPAEGTRVSGVVTVSGPGMASRTKKVSYGNAPVGHFTMEASEVSEA